MKNAFPDRRGHNVYVVKLHRAVLQEQRFVDANPDYVRSKKQACLYVGMTGLTPKERFSNHKRGHKASRIVKKYGMELMPAFYQRLNPMTYEQAKAEEIALAERLRRRGYAVYQN